MSSPPTGPSAINEPSVPFNDTEDRTPEELLYNMKRPPIRTPEVGVGMALFGQYFSRKSS